MNSMTMNQTNSRENLEYYQNRIDYWMEQPPHIGSKIVGYYKSVIAELKK